MSTEAANDTTTVESIVAYFLANPIKDVSQVDAQIVEIHKLIPTATMEDIADALKIASDRLRAQGKADLADADHLDKLAKMTPRARNLRAEIMVQTSDALKGYLAEGMTPEDMAAMLWQGNLMLFADVARIMAERSPGDPKPNLQVKDQRGYWLAKAEGVFREAFMLEKATAYGFACFYCGHGLAADAISGFDDCPACDKGKPRTPAPEAA